MASVVLAVFAVATLIATEFQGSVLRWASQLAEWGRGIGSDPAAAAAQVREAALAAAKTLSAVAARGLERAPVVMLGLTVLLLVPVLPWQGLPCCAAAGRP